MPLPFSETLQDWQSFYFMLGGAAATLIGLIFVAMSLGAPLVSAETQEDIDTFVAPQLVCFIVVLMVAGIMLLPATSATDLAPVLVIPGGVGLVQIVWVMGKLLQADNRSTVSKSHWLWHAALPLLSYSLIAGGAWWLRVGEASGALAALAVATALLLLSAIWRSWELVLWIAHQRTS